MAEMEQIVNTLQDSQVCAECTCDPDQGANRLLCVAIPCGIEINLLGLVITVGPVCINAEDVEDGAEATSENDPKAQLEALQGLLGYLSSHL
ncbi:hypothetical protein [Halobacillus sp. Marseille-Q1614]|uniref:hypothetical protein n=1 Tax=Halobacillus sp. Marseille-Q1614 TaxID=2709134 RepID=UPI001570107A|nr:hypothetical protein [Halobacillus sp. Marseille-Q1614]